MNSLTRLPSDDLLDLNEGGKTTLNLIPQNPPSIIIESQSSSKNLNKELSEVREEEYDDSKCISQSKDHHESKSSSSENTLLDLNDFKSSEQQNFENNEENYKENHEENVKNYRKNKEFTESNENIKDHEDNDNNSHFSPLVDLNRNEEEGDNEISEDSMSVELEENQAMKLRQEPAYKKYKWLVFPDDTFKEKWEIVLGIMILYACLWVPYFMAFSENADKNNLILVVDAFSDLIFFIDVVINFNSAFYNSQDVLIVKHSKIAKEYLKFWFWLDFISALPFSFLIEYQNTEKSLQVQKLIKLSRFIRIFKMIKEKNQILKYLNEVLKITSGAENLLGPVVFMAMFCHVSACFYYMISVSEDHPDNWIVDYQDKSDSEKYLTVFYWVTQTVVTTGYGDIACVTTYEKLFAILLMFIGVLVYSFCVGSLSNFLINLDQNNENFNQLLVTLYSMKHYYNLDFFLCKKIERFLKFGKKIQIQEQQKNFLMDLPKNLKIELSAIIYKNYINGVDFFKDKPRRFMAFICPYLKTIKFSKGDYICEEGDRANEIYFIKSGRIAIVLKDFMNFKFMSIMQGFYFGEVSFYLKFLSFLWKFINYLFLIEFLMIF